MEISNLLVKIVCFTVASGLLVSRATDGVHILGKRSNDFEENDSYWHPDNLYALLEWERAVQHFFKKSKGSSRIPSGVQYKETTWVKLRDLVSLLNSFKPPLF
ncbi:uncharacterized protein LOC143234149 isoform X3 [Tachypleus tridentatus]|uniref:uncharacterized protein LOC143234149 isoform X3 n=1 Tax=Tachypleus tridentatus TaxID=6853 RepID=UPI003FD3E0F0